MVTFNLAYTAAVNPPDTETVVTADQLWKAMERKVRHGDEFVPVITECVVEEEKNGGTEVTRKVIFKTGHGMKPEVLERCVLKAPCRTEFYQEDGSFVQNVVSVDAKGALFLSYVFEWIKPHIELGTAKYDEEAATLQKTAKMAVESSLDVVRAMIRDGRIA